MLIDVHAHLYHPDWYPIKFQKYLVKDFLKRRKKEINEEIIERDLNKLNKILSDPTGEMTIRIMDKLGIQKKIILIIDWGLDMGEAVKDIKEIHQDILAICNRFSDRLVGFSGIDPCRKNAEEILRWSYDELGAKGLKLHPTSKKWTLKDESVTKLIKITEEYKYPVLMHSGESLDFLTSKPCSPEAIVDIAKRFPDVNFIAGHSAFERWKDFSLYGELPENLFFDISAWQEAFSSDEVLKENIKDIFSIFKGKVFFGTDSPFFSFNFPLTEQHWIMIVKECLEEINIDINNLNIAKII